MMKKRNIFCAVWTAALLLCLPLTALAQESESTTAPPTVSMNPVIDQVSADIPEFLHHNNNFVNSYDVSKDIQDYFGMEEGDQIVQIHESWSNYAVWFADGRSVEELISKAPRATAYHLYAIRHADGSVTQKRVTQDNVLEEGEFEEIPDAVWSYDVIRKVDPAIEVKEACILNYSFSFQYGTHGRVFLIFYKTNLGEYAYYHRLSQGYGGGPKTYCEYLFPYETFCGIQNEFVENLRAKNPDGMLNGGDMGDIFTQTSFDLSSYNLSSPSFHIDAPERPRTGLYVALGIGGGLALIAAIAIPLAVRARKRRRTGG